MVVAKYDYSQPNLKEAQFSSTASTQGKTRTTFQMEAFPAANDNASLPTPEDHANLFLYLMSDELRENGACFYPGDR